MERIERMKCMQLSKFLPATTARVDSGEIPLKLSLVKVAESPDNRTRALTHAFLPSMAGDSATGTQ